MGSDQVNKKENRLWVFEHYAVPPRIAGFVRQFDHVRFMKQRGWDGRIFASSYNHKTHVYEQPTTPLKPVMDGVECGVDFTWVYTTPYVSNDWKRYLNMVSYFVTAQIGGFGKKGRPDAVLGASPHLLAALAGWMTAKRLRVPFVLEIQDLWPESLVQLGLSNRPIIWALERLESFLYHQADAIVTLTDGITVGVERKLKTPKRIVRIQNGASLFPRIDSQARFNQRRDRGWDGKWVVIWAGAHAPANSLDTVVEAARICSANGNEQVHFAFVGDGPEKPMLMNMAKDLPNIEFLDPVPANEVQQILQLADAGVLVHSDTIAVRGSRPTKLTEYMAAGIPVISNIQGEPERLIADADCGLTVPTRRPDLLADAICQAAMDAVNMQSKGQNGTGFVQDTHNRETLALKLVDLLDELVNN